MTSIVRAKSTTDFKALDEGTHLAICNAVIIVGPQETPYGTKEHCFLRFEVPDERVQYFKNGEEFDVPQTISARYNMTLTKKSHLRKDLEAWRGKEFTAEQLNGFDLFNLVGRPCLLTVVHNHTNDRTYANITAVAKVLRGQEIPPQELPSIRFSPDDTDQYDDLPDWLREKFDNRIEPEEPQPPQDDIKDEDIPY